MCTLASVILCSWYAFCAMPRLRFEKDCLIWLAPCTGVFKASATHLHQQHYYGVKHCTLHSALFLAAIHFKGECHATLKMHGRLT